MADQVITFTQDGEFSAYYTATKWLQDHGYSYGSMCMDMPIGILKGSWCIAKWRNLSSEERQQLDGTISCINTFREAPIHVVIKDKSL